MKKDVLDYRLAVRGLFGRNRKDYYETFLLVEEVDPKAPKALEELLPLARQKLREIKFRAGKWWLREEPVEVEESTVGEQKFKTKSFVLMSEKKMHEEVVA